MKTLLLKFLTRALLPMLFGLVGGMTGRSCEDDDPPAVRAEPVHAPVQTYVEVSAELHEWQPRAVEWLQTAADQWCEAGLECAIVYVEGEAQPDGRIIRAELAGDLGGASGVANASENYLRIWRGADFIMPGDPRCEAPGDVDGNRIDRTLAHELGHVLGLHHICSIGGRDDSLPVCTEYHKFSIMYPQGDPCFYGNVDTYGAL